MADTGVAGLMTTPARAPARWIARKVPSRCLTSLLMDDHLVGAGIDEDGRVLAGIGDHEMDVQA